VSLTSRINFGSALTFPNGISRHHHVPGSAHIMLPEYITCFTDKYILTFNLCDTIQGIGVDYRYEKYDIHQFVQQ
jgi:hypothetical protein